MKKLILLPVISTLGFASVITPELIKDDTTAIQVAVVKSYKSLKPYLNYFESEYDLIIEKINKHTIYIVNVNNDKKEQILEEVKSKVGDAFIISKKNYFQLKNKDASFFVNKSKQKDVQENVKKEKLIVTKVKMEEKEEFSREEFDKNEYQAALNSFKNKDYNKSYEMFSNLFLNNMGNVLINFYLGRSAYELGNYEFALSAYDRILIQEPNNNRVRLELAQTYMKMELYDQALREYEQTLDGKMPELVRKRVLANVDAIKNKQKKHFFNVTAMLGILYDSNINVAPDVKDFNLPGSNLPISSPDKQSTTIYQAIGVLNYKYKVNENLFLDNSLTALQMKYINHKDKDLGLYSASFRPTFLNKNSKISLGFSIDKIHQGHEGYQKNFYFNPTYTRVLGSSTMYDASAKIGLITFDDEKNRDANLYEIANLFKYSTVDYGLMNFGVVLGKEREKRETRTDVSYDYLSLIFGNSYSISNSWTLNSSLSYKNSNYKDTDVLFLSKRKDKKLDASLELQKVLNKNLFMNTGVTYTKNDSNHVASEYDKYTLRASMFYNF